MHKKKFNNNDQVKFSKLSGDLNPIHLDQSYAANTLFQKIVVHGLNIVIWSLEKVIPSNIKNIIRIKINFLKIVYLNEEIFLNVIKKNKNEIQIIIKSKIEEKIIIKTFISNKKIFFKRNIHNLNYNKKIILKRKILKKINGFLYLQKNIKLIKRNFPKINNTIAVEKIIRLISLSRLVGIQLNSNPGILASIDLSFQNCNLKNKILFKVKKFIKKFSFCELDIEGNGIKAKIEAFIIPELNDFSFKKIKQKIPKKLFLRKNVLIIGGSNGLGEIAVKILCALDANVTFTYNNNYINAKRIILDIKKNHLKCKCVKFNVTKIKKKDTKFLKSKEFENIYYFPTPKIMPTKKFNNDLYKKYLNYYVLSFKKILKNIKNCSKKKIKIFFPSTIYISEKNKKFQEYVNAKKKAENICNSINKRNNLQYHVLYERLPRILTRQSSSFYDLNYSDGFKIILNIIKKLNNIK